MLTVPSTGEDTEQLELSHMAGGGIQRGPALLENRVVASDKVKDTLTGCPSNPTLRIIIDVWKFIFTQKPVHECLQQRYS